MNHDHAETRNPLGAYLLGGLDADDRATFENHLSTCAPCRDELSRSAALPSLLRSVDHTGHPSTEQTQPAAAPQLALLLRRRLRRTRRRRALSAAVAAAVVVTGLVLVPPLLRPATPPTAAVVQLTGTDGAPTGRAVLDPRPWGTAVTLSAVGLPADGPFALEITSRTGNHERAASWGTTSDGHAQVTGATSLPPGSIERLQILGPDGLVAESS